jgi:hypothetical protein
MAAKYKDQRATCIRRLADANLSQKCVDESRTFSPRRRDLTSEETGIGPKPTVEIAGRPIIWHIKNAMLNTGSPTGSC